MRMMTTPKETGNWLRKTLETSGPTYVKIGQFIGNRPDLFGETLSMEVSKLQNKVSTFKLSEKPNSIFKLDDEPFASASIAQVHSGILRDGRRVAVKIKRPGIDQQLLSEMNSIRSVLNFAKMINTNMDLISEWFSDFEKTVIDELDFSKEVNNITLFNKIYKYNTEIRVPRVLPSKCSKDTIVMEYLPSRPLIESSNKMATSMNLMNMFVEQILYNGIIHGDLHYGNMGIDDDTIILYDFGNVIQIPEYYQNAMRRVIAAVQARDTKNLLSAMESMGMVIIDMKAAEQFTKNFFKYVETLDPKSFTYSKDDIMVPIKLDTITLTILRTYSLVEGVCRYVYPEFTYQEIIQQNLELLLVEQFVYRIREGLGTAEE